MFAGGGGNSEAKVIRPAAAAAAAAMVFSTLPPPPPLIKNEWWAVWVKERNGGLCPGDTERVSVTQLLDTPQTAVDDPGGHDEEGNKAVQRSLIEMNYCVCTQR